MVEIALDEDGDGSMIDFVVCEVQTFEIDPVKFVEVGKSQWRNVVFDYINT